MQNILMRTSAVALLGLSLAACASGGGIANTKAQQQEAERVVHIWTSPFSEANKCLGKYLPVHNYGVGQHDDSTGQGDYSVGGVGRFVTQGGHHLTMNALMDVGMPTYNLTVDTMLDGLRKRYGWPLATMQVDRVFNGSTTWVDRDGGKLAEASFGGFGAGVRAYAQVIHKDMFLTDVRTGKTIRSIAMSQPITGHEIYLSLAKFFGDKFADANINWDSRHSVAFVERAMHKRGVYALLRPEATGEGVQECDKLMYTATQLLPVKS